MKKIFALFLISPLLISEEKQDERLVSELTVDELKEIVKEIVEETIEQCVVIGTMEGRAKVNLKVEGEVVAKMECELNKTKNNDSIKNKNL
jgi:hypothetical protein